jgi:hypothetical protein
MSNQAPCLSPPTATMEKLTTPKVVDVGGAVSVFSALVVMLIVLVVVGCDVTVTVKVEVGVIVVVAATCDTANRKV